MSKTYPYWKKVVFSKKVALDTKSYILTYMPKLFRRTPKSFFSASGKHEKHNYIFSPKASSCLKMLLSKRRMLFWQHWQNFSWKQSENFSSNLKMTKKFLLLKKKKFRPKLFLWRHEKQFQTTLPEIFRSKHYNKSKTFKFCPRKSSKKLPLDT